MGCVDKAIENLCGRIQGELDKNWLSGREAASIRDMAAALASLAIAGAIIDGQGHGRLPDRQK